MRIWLDDIREMPADYDVHVRTAAEAITLLRDGKVTAISLDHDLEPEHYHSDCKDGTGYEVALFIEQGAFHGCIPKLEWAIHSMNPAGRKRINQAMNSAERFWREGH